MKMNFSISVCYILYMAAALCLSPIKSVDLQSSTKVEVVQLKAEKPMAPQNAEILHSELLFENAGF